MERVSIPGIQINANPLNEVKIGTWNLCLGLSNKKDTVTSYLYAFNIGVCFLL